MKKNILLLIKKHIIPIILLLALFAIETISLIEMYKINDFQERNIDSLNNQVKVLDEKLNELSEENNKTSCAFEK